MSAHKNVNSLQSPLAKAKNLGSSRTGLKSWWMMKVTSVALIPLSLWFMYSIISMQGASRADIASWLSSPFAAVAAVLFLVTLFYHSYLGIKEVIEDYVHCHAMKISSLLGLNFLLLAMTLVTVLAVVKLHFGGI